MLTIRCERSFTTSVNDIEHMESQSLPGLSIIKVFFYPNAKIEAAVAQLAASSQSVLHSLPLGIFPPVDPPLQRVECPYPAIEPLQRDA